MPTDIKLDQQGGNWLDLEGSVLKTTATDLMLDSPARRRGGPSPHRRALVHDFQDGLTINFAGDYPGGVTVTGNLAVTGDLRLAGMGSAPPSRACSRRSRRSRRRSARWDPAWIPWSGRSHRSSS